MLVLPYDRVRAEAGYGVPWHPFKRVARTTSDLCHWWRGFDRDLIQEIKRFWPWFHLDRSVARGEGKGHTP